MRCPVCKRVTFSRGNPYRPFCSERCQLLDLDNWLSERYRVSTPIESREKPQPVSLTPPDEAEERD